MDNGEKERAVLVSFKRTVKHTSRRKTASEPSKRPDHIVRIAPKSATLAGEVSTSGFGSSSQIGVRFPPDHGFLPEHNVSTSHVESVVSVLMF